MRFWQNKVTRGAAIAVLGAALLGCSNTESLSSQAKIETQAEVLKPTVAEEFTTKGKPTKTIETPWGPREVYDPAKDNVFKIAFEKVFLRGDVTFGDISRFNGTTSNNPEVLSKYDFPKGVTPSVPTQDAITLRLARQTQYYDMMRLGCKVIDEIPNQNYGHQHLSRSCSGERLGRPQLSECELGRTLTVTEVQNPEVVKVPADDRHKGRWYVFHGREKQIGQYLTATDEPFYTAYSRPINLSGVEQNIQNVFFIGPQSGLTTEESYAALTYIGCQQWHDKSFFELKNIGK